MYLLLPDYRKPQLGCCISLKRIASLGWYLVPASRTLLLRFSGT